MGFSFHLQVDYELCGAAFAFEQVNVYAVTPSKARYSEILGVK